MGRLSRSAQQIESLCTAAEAILARGSKLSAKVLLNEVRGNPHCTDLTYRSANNFLHSNKVGQQYMRPSPNDNSLPPKKRLRWTAVDEAAFQEAVVTIQSTSNKLTASNTAKELKGSAASYDQLRYRLRKLTVAKHNIEETPDLGVVGSRSRDEEFVNDCLSIRLWRSRTACTTPSVSHGQQPCGKRLQVSEDSTFTCSVHGKLKGGPSTFSKYILTGLAPDCSVDGTSYSVELHFHDMAIHRFLGFPAGKASAIKISSDRKYAKLVLTPLLSLSDGTLIIRDATLRTYNNHSYIYIREFQKVADEDAGDAHGSQHAAASEEAAASDGSMDCSDSGHHSGAVDLASSEEQQHTASGDEGSDGVGGDTDEDVSDVDDEEDERASSSSMAASEDPVEDTDTS
ncbi:hypothetical protein Agub_g11300 [Astrephomene gubernaculifera]|uniref:Uncharacterized protein n=1 Tax=Astrephomene gubernaculifera TaxID=47775 RepID=A0AAD3HPT0_9CHLO|nr:hypothetical protein Agub_g11300 [Astrephomene gubernaculifera]